MGIGHLGNNWFTDLCNSFKWSLYNIKNITYVNSTNNLISGVSSIERCQAQVGKSTFSKILIFAWKFKVYHWQQILTVLFSWSNRLILFIFKKTSLPNTQVWIIIVIFSSRDYVPLKKPLVQLAIQTSFSSSLPLYFGRSAFMCTSNFHHTQCLKICVFKNRDLIKLMLNQRDCLFPMHV